MGRPEPAADTSLISDPAADPSLISRSDPDPDPSLVSCSFDGAGSLCVKEDDLVSLASSRVTCRHFSNNDNTHRLRSGFGQHAQAIFLPYKNICLLWPNKVP